MSTGLYAVQHIRRMRGGSQAHLLRASDGAYYVTKFQNNPQHVRVLANEMFATRLAQWLGLPVPQVEVIDISDWLIANTPELRVEVGGAAVPCSSGRQLGSLYCCDPSTSVFDYLPEQALGRVANLQDFARILAFDKWTGNSDGRQAIFSRKNNRGCYYASFIDHGYCFNAGEWSFADSPQRGVYPRNCVYADVMGWESFEPALSRAEEADILDLWLCAELMPGEWYGHDAGALSKLVEELFARRKRIRELIRDFRYSSRNPFPNWTDGTILPNPRDALSNKPDLSIPPEMTKLELPAD